MQIFSLIILAVVLGGAYTIITPRLQALIPANAPTGKIAVAFYTGAFILVAFVAASTVLKFVGVRKAV